MYKAEYKQEETRWGDYRLVLVIKHKDKIIAEYRDGGEPEDNSFYRDWNWIAGELAKAYKLGFQDADETAKLGV